MPGFLLSVTTVTHHREYGKTPWREIQTRAPMFEDSRHHAINFQKRDGCSAGPCGSLASVRESAGWVFYELLGQLRAYQALYGDQPLGAYYRNQGARTGPRGRSPVSLL